ncbi:MAG: hypothetical protein A2283_15860 [Lentisphaerae bacterium RIFOXYA12_FULL_48_11]|nr:MAG: hypothetical protein A2283_15860 [Lentisphaerae bacterium RIFOXYA12_FULL_48_11]
MKKQNIKICCCILIACIVPLCCIAISLTKDSTRKDADYVFCGKVVSISKSDKKADSKIEILMKVSIELLDQHKGKALTNKTISVYYDTPSSNSIGRTCPPYVTVEVGKTYLFAAITNILKKLPNELYMPSGDFVDSTNNCKSANQRMEHTR